MRIPNILTFARFDSYQEILFPDKKSLRQILLQTKKFSDNPRQDNLRQVFGPQSEYSCRMVLRLCGLIGYLLASGRAVPSIGIA